jgi:hypothetical protein
MASNPDSSYGWQSIATKAQSAVITAIPSKWKLPAGIPRPGQTNVLDVPETCGILSPKQLEITSLTASELVTKLRTAELSAVVVTEAFCARAAIAHQLVNCLTDYFPEEALARAEELDRILTSKLSISWPKSSVSFNFLHQKAPTNVENHECERNDSNSETC